MTCVGMVPKERKGTLGPLVPMASLESLGPRARRGMLERKAIMEIRGREGRGGRRVRQA